MTFGSAQRSGLIEPSSGSLSNLVLRSAGSIDEANTAGVRVGEIKVVEVGEGQTDATLDGCRRRQSRTQGDARDQCSLESPEAMPGLTQRPRDTTGIGLPTSNRPRSDLVEGSSQVRTLSSSWETRMTLSSSRRRAAT